MGALADISDLINRSTGGNSGTPQNQFWFKVPRINGSGGTFSMIAGRPASLWQLDGQPAGGAIPGAGAIPDNTTVGALPFNSPGGGRQAWMTQAWVTGLNAGTLVLYDRLFHMGGLSATVQTPQAVQGDPASPAITRNTGGVGNFVFAEINTLIGTTGVTIRMEYTDQDGNTGALSPEVQIGGTGFREVTRAIMLPLVSGDRGVRAVKEIDLNTTTGTAGNFGIVIGRPLAYLAVGFAGAPGWRDFVSGLPGIPEIEAGSCLSLLWFPATTGTPELFGGYSLVEA